MVLVKPPAHKSDFRIDKSGSTCQDRRVRIDDKADRALAIIWLLRCNFFDTVWAFLLVRLRIVLQVFAEMNAVVNNLEAQRLVSTL